MSILRIIRIVTALALAVTLFGLYMLVMPPDVVFAAPNEINGTVFLDYNGDGQRDGNDIGIGGVTVTAYDPSGGVLTSTTTQANGTYTLAVSDNTEVRVEFTNIPADLRPGAIGTDSSSTVVFVTSPVDNVDMGLLRPQDYCQDDPYLASPCYFNGNPLIPGSDASTAEVLRTFPYSASGQNPGLQEVLATGLEIGPTWGLAYQRSSQTLFAGALMKRHAGFGPLGTGGIYSVEIDPATGQAVSGPTPFLDLNTIGIPTGIDPHSGLPTVGSTPNTDPNSWDAVGKISIGDMDMSGDDERLWITNLFDQTLYSINFGIPAVAPTSPASVVGYSMVAAMQSVGGPAANCAASDVRPWAVDVHEGYIYVGVICSAQSFPVPAQSVQAVDALRAYILRRPDNTSAAPFELVFDFDLDYPRSYASADQDIPAQWRPWIGTMTTLCHYVDATTCNLPFDKQIIYPQPILSDIEFDDDGSIIIALMDRAGHQTGTANYATSNPWGTPTLYRDHDYPAFVTFTADYTATSTFEGVAPGDILRICEVGGVYALENNATCGGVTTSGANSTPGQGPGGGEYYWQEMYPAQANINGGTHTETVVGGLVLLPGSGEVGTSIFDPFEILSGGVAWLNNQTGASNRRYEILPQDNSPTTFGKAAGLGDIEAFCYQPPIEIGNRIWFDENEDGIQDPGEAPLAGVTLELYQGSTLIATVITDAEGNFIFSSGPGTSTTSHQYGLNLLPNTDYELRIPFAEGVSQQPALAGLFLTGANTDPGGNGDSRDSDGQLVGVFAFINLTTGAMGDNNHTYDFGFAPEPPVDPPGGGGGGGGAAGTPGLFGFIPDTGFAPNRVTDLSGLPVTKYNTSNEVGLEIPALQLEMPVVGVPKSNNTWDVNWLLYQAGWLEGSAFPGFSGNSVLTSHVTLSYGQAGPFANLHKLKTGDMVYVRAFGNLYIYEIRWVKELDATDPSILQHEDKPWLTLVTCADYSEEAETYLKRLVVKAALVQAQPERWWYSWP